MNMNKEKETPIYRWDGKELHPKPEDGVYSCLGIDCPERTGGKCNVLERIKETEKWGEYPYDKGFDIRNQSVRRDNWIDIADGFIFNSHNLVNNSPESTKLLRELQDRHITFIRNLLASQKEKDIAILEEVRKPHKKIEKYFALKTFSHGYNERNIEVNRSLDEAINKLRGEK